jgi:DNA invertase Pin-like site-specific DNA recombinase
MNETRAGKRAGYARVSTYGQTLDAQTAQLRADGCTVIYAETASGAEANRRELRRMLRSLTPGDVLTVTRIDRLARSTFDLFAIVKQIAEAGAQFRSLAEPWADTGTSTGRLMLAVLAGLADVERDLIKTRTAEGRVRATARGQHMGRPASLTRQQQAEAQDRRDAGATLADLSRSYNVSKATISRATRAGAALAGLLIAVSLSTLPSRAQMPPSPAPGLTIHNDSLARALDDLASLQRCIRQDGSFALACVRRTLASLPPEEAAAFAMFGAFDALYGGQDHRSREDGDYLWALGR